MMSFILALLAGICELEPSSEYETELAFDFDSFHEPLFLQITHHVQHLKSVQRIHPDTSAHQMQSLPLLLF